MSPVPTTMTRRLLAGAATAAVAVSVSIFGAVSAHAADVPTITAVSPATGSNAGGTTVVVTGTGFTDSNTDPTASVALIAAGATYTASYTYVSATTIDVTTPPVTAIGVYGIAFQNATGETVQTSADDFTYTLKPGSAPILTGPATTTYGSTVALSGNAVPGDAVLLYGHGPGGTYAVIRTTTATAGGTFAFSYDATSDERYYAADGMATSPAGLTQVGPTVTGPTTKVVAEGSTVTISGTAGLKAGVVSIHFHKAGTAANDYSIVRTAAVAANGRWSRTYAATVDYRFYVTSTNGLRTATYLYQAR